MRLDNLVSLIGGELKNSPSITQISHIGSRLQQIRRGSLFLAKDKSQVDEAIKAGAYAIAYEGWIQISDQEIAWIKVPDLQKAALRLVRFLLLQSQIPARGLDDLEWDLAKALINDRRVYILDNPFDTLQALQEQAVQLILYPSHLKALDLSAKPLPLVDIQITQSYLFETSFVCEDRFYERIRFPELFLPALQRLLSLAKEHHFELQFGSLEQFPHFRPIFVDSTFTPQEFGKSEKVVITEPDMKLAEKERDYLLSKASWSKLLFLSDRELSGFRHYRTIDELKEILYNTPFNFALIHTKALDLSALEKPKCEQTFF